MLPTPTPDELCDWLRVAHPGTATGTVVWTPDAEEWSFGWAHVGEPPVFAYLPAGQPVRFAFGGDGRWSLEGPDGALGRSDGRRAVAWQEGRPEFGGDLLAVPGPAQLLLPSAPEVAAGEVVADERLGRACWRWTSGADVRWVDEQTGCLLAAVGSTGTLELTEFDPGAEVDPSSFAVRGGPRAVRQPVRAVVPQAPFTVTWWPHGCLSHPVGGDPDEPSLLVELATTDPRSPRVWLGVAPLGRRAPVRPGTRSRRWDGADCSLALSWTRRLGDDEVERVVASVPDRWR